MIDFEDFEDEGFGIIIPAVELQAEPLPPVPPRWEKPRWWSPHQSLEDHSADTIRRYGRPTLDRLDAGEDDPVFPHQGAIVSLADLTAPFEPWRGDWINETK